jgi:heat shock protein HslJ
MLPFLSRTFMRGTLLLTCMAFTPACNQTTEPSLPDGVSINLRGTSWVLSRVNAGNDGKDVVLPVISTPLEQNTGARQPFYAFSFSAQVDSIQCSDNCNGGTILYTLSPDNTITFDFRAFTRLGCQDYSYDKYFGALRSNPSSRYAVDSTYLVLFHSSGQFVFRRVDRL